MAEKKRRREVGKTRSRNEEKRTNVAVVFAEAAAAELTRSRRRSLLFFFAPPSLLPLEKYTESLLLSFLSEEEKEHRPKSLMRLEATRGELGRRSPLPVPLWGSLLLLFPHRNRLRNWRSRREGKNAQLVWFPKKNLTGKKEYEFDIKRASHHSTICLPDSLTFIPHIGCPFFIGPILLLFDDKYAGLPATTKAGIHQPTDRSLLPHGR